MILRLLYAAAVIIIAVYSYKLWTFSSAFSTLATAPLGNSIGAEDADITLIEIVDYRCNHCRSAHTVIQELQKNRPDVRVVFRHMPIFGRPSLHDAQFALAAGMQGHFEEIHNRLMQRDEPASEEYIETTILELGLDYDKFMHDLKGPDIGDYFMETMNATDTLKIRQTPTFIVNKTIYQNTRNTIPTWQELSEFIDHVK